MDKIFIGVPAYNGISALTTGTIIYLLNSSNFNCKLSIHPDCALVALARSELLGKFLESDCSHFLFLDADISFDPYLITRMLSVGLDVVVSSYASRHPPYKANINNIVPKNIFEHNGENLIEIHSTGLGCCLVSRKAIEETCKAFPQLEYDAESCAKSFALFLEEVLPSPTDGKIKFMGEDIMFFIRLREAGFPAYAMIDATIAHDGRFFCLADLLKEENPTKKRKKK